jgi:outer membrane receptor for ferrienterochelin and colicins
MIRGPGAVIYGSNASASVINIITKQTSQSVVAFSAGSHNKINGGGYIYQGISADSVFPLSFEGQSEDSYKLNTPMFYNPPSFRQMPVITVKVLN